MRSPSPLNGERAGVRGENSNKRYLAVAVEGRSAGFGGAGGAGFTAGLAPSVFTTGFGGSVTWADLASSFFSVVLGSSFFSASKSLRSLKSGSIIHLETT